MSKYQKMAYLMVVGLFISALVVGCGGSNSNITSPPNSSPTGTPGPTPTGGNETSTRLLPANNATNVCVDTLLKITFDNGTTPVIGSAGTIKIYKASDNTVVDTINLSDPSENVIPGVAPSKLTSSYINKIGNSEAKLRIVNYRPVVIKNNSVVIIPHNNKLSYNTQYYVTIDSGALLGTINASAFTGITDKTTWTFTTKTAAPTGMFLSVNGNGTGDFCTIQGAIDNIPVANTTNYTINIADGIYEEMLFIYNKENITFHGASRKGTIIQYDNGEHFNSGSGGGTKTSDSSATGGGRSVMLVSNSSGLVIDNLTLKSTHAQKSTGKDQAEFMYLNGTSAKYIVKNCDLISYQDTVQNKGYCWYYNCFITGDVDFIWGYATVALFENCEIQSRLNSSGGYVVHARAAAGNKGYVFLNCELTKESDSVTGTYLARSAHTSNTDGSGSSWYDNVAYINCKMDDHILPVGWQLFESSKYPGPLPATADAINGWKEYGSTDLSGTALNVSSRLSPGSHQLTSSEYESLYKDRATIFGGSWNPQP